MCVCVHGVCVESCVCVCVYICRGLCVCNIVSSPLGLSLDSHGLLFRQPLRRHEG